MVKSRDPSAISKLKSKEELQKLYKHRAPPKLPTIVDTKENIFADIQHTKETQLSGMAWHCDSLEQWNPLEQRSQEVIQERNTVPPEKQNKTKQ